MAAPGWPTARREFGPSATAPAEARLFLGQHLLRWGVHEEAADALLMVASELVSNAVDHAQTPLELAASYDGAAVLLEVQDQSPTPPTLQPHDPLAARGRGLQMVAALAVRWDYVRNATGKTVRALVVAIAVWLAAAWKV
ncbi:MAG: hypothetical protein QOG20_5346 [Pseudonocardiales bacterium]|jgi:anti-sigma regulatory factor (Ser/Thr protein kinase)|nr:hypothetical protein [Pseudonocardiales bacterium]